MCHIKSVSQNNSPSFTDASWLLESDVSALQRFSLQPHSWRSISYAFSLEGRHVEDVTAAADDRIFWQCEK